MTLTLIYFAVLRDLLGLPEETVEWAAPGSTVQQLIDGLSKRRNSLSMEGVRIAVNEEFVQVDHVLKDGDVVAFIPPVSGG